MVDSFLSLDSEYAYARVEFINCVVARPLRCRCMMLHTSALASLCLRCAHHDTVLCRAQELAQVKVNKDDVKVIVKEFEVDNKVADAKLRANGGDLRQTLIAMLHEGLPSEG